MENQKAIIFFDGVCNLCNAMLRLILKIDKKTHFKLASIQGETYEKMQSQGLLPQNVDSIVYFKDGISFIKSLAVFEIAKDLGGIYKVLLVFNAFPKKWNDALYDFVAANRYALFGKRDQCQTGKSAMFKGRFLD